MKTNSSINVDLGRGLKLKNPVMVASGTFGYGLEYEDLTNLANIGAIVVKGLSPKPRVGNKPPRIVETASGMLNSIGLQNIGVHKFIEEKLPRLINKHATVVANVYGETEEEYEYVVKQLSSPNADGVVGLEINVSCPNVKAGGLAFGTRADMLGSLVKRLRRATDKHLMIKLSPNVTDIAEMALVCEQAGADSLSVINTLLGIAVDLEKRSPKLGGITGGLSGPAIKPVALRMAWQVAKAVKIPVIGIGGITTAVDALEFICVGCRAVQIGTANFTHPQNAARIAEGMQKWLSDRDIADIAQLVGTFTAS